MDQATLQYFSYVTRRVDLPEGERAIFLETTREPLLAMSIYLTQMLVNPSTGCSEL